MSEYPEYNLVKRKILDHINNALGEWRAKSWQKFSSIGLGRYLSAKSILDQCKGSISNTIFYGTAWREIDDFIEVERDIDTFDPDFFYETIEPFIKMYVMPFEHLTPEQQIFVASEIF